jgi:hypothetical protein
MREPAKVNKWRRGRPQRSSHRQDRRTPAGVAADLPISRRSRPDPPQPRRYWLGLRPPASASTAAGGSSSFLRDFVSVLVSPGNMSPGSGSPQWCSPPPLAPTSPTPTVGMPVAPGRPPSTLRPGVLNFVHALVPPSFPTCGRGCPLRTNALRGAQRTAVGDTR